MVVTGENDSYWKFCGFHVHSLTLVIAILSMILHIAVAIGNFVTATYFMYAGGVITLISSILLILGNRKRTGVLYWPYMILQTIVVIGYIIAAIFFFILAVSLTKKDYDYYGLRKTARIVAIVLGIIYLLVTLVQIIFLWIVYRDYRFVRNFSNHIVHHHPPPTAVVYQTPVAPTPQVIVVDSCDPHHHHHYDHSYPHSHHSHSTGHHYSGGHHH
ncbi:hypothetical protein M3Y96_01203300 [Aphelenchoides besseyi]|nr:hypothetical protein M3Y96_01203300 [Aphelenchoides besseyi]